MKNKKPVSLSRADD